jgi:aspartate-semialdehyde dehydrogenase
MAIKIPTAILGATGAVGQRFISLLESHPWFEIVSITGSERSVGRKYAEAVHWVVPGEMPSDVGDLTVLESDSPGDVQLVFSALPSKAAREVEPQLAEKGYFVCSNASALRMAEDVPLLVPPVNADHLSLIDAQQLIRGWQGCIVTSPNCSAYGISFPLKALDRAFGLQQVHAVTMQAISGAGYPGISSFDILDNVIPHINGEDEKIENEPRKLLGKLEGDHIEYAPFIVSAQANRVPVTDGHLASLSVKLAVDVDIKDVRDALSSFEVPENVKRLPSSAPRFIILRDEPDRPQPRRDRDAEGGMTVSVGKVRSCSLLDFRLVSLVHNTLLGAAGGAILNAELLAVRGYLGEFPS